MNDLKNPTLPLIAETIFHRIEQRVTETKCKQITDEDLLNLYSVFGVVLQRALDILEKYPTFTIYVTSNQLKKLIEIKGEQHRCYRVFPKLNFCPCYAFKHQVTETKLAVTCKHVLAARLALILDRLTPHTVNNDQHLMLLKSMFDLENN